MPEFKQADIECIIEIIKAIYKNRIEETSLKLKNIDYINTEVLKAKILKELPDKKTPDYYQKVVSLIESLVQD